MKNRPAERNQHRGRQGRRDRRHRQRRGTQSRADGMEDTPEDPCKSIVNSKSFERLAKQEDKRYKRWKNAGSGNGSTPVADRPAGGACCPASTGSRREGRIGWESEGNIIQVHPAPGEIHFLVRGRPVEGSGSPPPAGSIDKRIILSPSVAKGLARLLEEALRDYEAAHGPASGSVQAVSDGGLEPGPASRRSILESVRGEEARRLIRSLDGLGVHYGFEQSFKALPGLILGNRFLAGFNKDSIRGTAENGDLSLLSIRGIPNGEFIRGLPERTSFSSAMNGGESVYKAYLEFGHAFERMFRKIHESFPVSHSPRLQVDVADKATRRRITYVSSHGSKELSGSCRMFFTAKRPGCRSTSSVNPGSGLGKDAPGGVPSPKWRRGNAGCPSISICTGRTCVSARLYPFLMAMCRYFSVPLADFHRLYESSKT